MTPYYQQDNITIYHGDCREVLPTLSGIDAVITDPPYGINTAVRSETRKRNRLAVGIDHAPVVGDDQPFDPVPLLGFAKVILWGANYYADKLPPASKWLVWDKRDGTTPDDNADVELAWSNLKGPARHFRYLWRGMIKAGERDEKRRHPTQKPVSLMMWCLHQAGSCVRVCDPFMGAGSTLVAAKLSGVPAVGIEVREDYCEIAANRLAQGVLFSGVQSA